MRKLLQVVGLLSLVVWTGVGALAWYSVTGKVVVQVRGDMPERGEVPRTALLRDEVEGLATDLRELAGTLEKSLERLARGLSEDGAERFAAQRADIAKLRRDLSGFEVRLEAREATSGREYAALRARVDAPTAELRHALGGGTVAAAPTTRPLLEEQARVAPGPGEVPGVEEPGTALPAREEPVDRASKQAKKSFLSFKFSAKNFNPEIFEEYEVIPALSRVGFDAQSTLHDFSGVTSRVRGTLAYTFATPAKDCRARIEVEAAGLKTGMDGRDEGLREHLATNDFPSILFVLESVERVAIDVKARTIEAVAKGKIRIRGVSRALSMPVKVAVDRRLRQQIAGETLIKLTDFKIPVPNQLGIVGMYDELKIWIALRLRLKARVRKQ